MSQKLTLARYLEGRGEVKSLTRIEAEAFGVPYPLVSGWPARYGTVEITAAMLQDLTTRVASAKRSTADKARRGLDAVGKNEPARQTLDVSPPVAASLVEKPGPVRTVHGFVLRRPRRSCVRRPAPWA